MARPYFHCQIGTVDASYVDVALVWDDCGTERIDAVYWFYQKLDPVESEYLSAQRAGNCPYTQWISVGGYPNLPLGGLLGGTNYRFRVAVQTSVSTYYSDACDQRTRANGTPNVGTLAATSIGSTSAYLGTYCSYAGGASMVGSFGNYYSRYYNYWLDTTYSVAMGTGNIGYYYGWVYGLQPNTTYYHQAYGCNDFPGCDRGQVLSFRTAKGAPALTTTAASDIEGTTATAGGNISNNGGEPVTDRGLCWSTGSTPTTGDTHTSDGTGSGAFASYMTGLSTNQLYYIRAYALNSIGLTYGNQLSFTTDTIPSVTTGAFTGVSFQTATGSSTVTDDGRGTVSARGACWNLTGSPTTADNYTSDGTGTGAFTSTLTGVPSENQTIYVRAYATNGVGTAYGGEETFVMFLAPTLSIASKGDKQVCLSWVNNSDNDGEEVWYRKETGDWHLWETVGTGVTTSCITGLSMQTFYTFEVHNRMGGDYLPSNRVDTTTTVTLLPPFCESDVAYVVSGSTCGNADGKITIGDEDYTIFYDFVMTNASDIIQQFTDYWWSGLTAGWYSITATPKLEYWYHYGNQPCTEGWIPIQDSDTTLSLVAVKIKQGICAGFGSGAGRINYIVTDSNPAVTGLTSSLWTWQQQLVASQSITGTTFTGNTNVTYEVSPDNYYSIVENSEGCHLLIDITNVGAINSYVIEGVQRLYLTEWTPSMSYTYYSNADDEWYVSGVDTLEYRSTKIAAYTGLTDFWYQITLDTATMDYEEKLQRGSDGITYAESVTVKIPHADNSKWKELSNVLTKRYTIVFQDNNDNWWTCFYENGADVKAYRRVDNQYEIQFRYPTTSKMITAIDYDYVKLNIL